MCGFVSYSEEMFVGGIDKARMILNWDCGRTGQEGCHVPWLIPSLRKIMMNSVKCNITLHMQYFATTSIQGFGDNVCCDSSEIY
jgi:hypothetical protein